MALDERQSIS